MKTAETLVHTLFRSNPKWRERRAIRALVSPLPAYMRDGVKAGWVKGGVLTLLLANYAMRTEFYTKRDHLRAIYNSLRRETEIFNDVEIKDFKFAWDKESDFAAETEEILRYEERASGDFEIAARSEAVREAFLKLKEILRGKTLRNH